MRFGKIMSKVCNNFLSGASKSSALYGRFCFGFCDGGMARTYSLGLGPAFGKLFESYRRSQTGTIPSAQKFSLGIDFFIE